jgi:hypothetical protein
VPGKRGRQRPIVARFLLHIHLAKVLSNTYRLKGKQYGVNQQYPDAIEQAHKWLYPTTKQKNVPGLPWETCQRCVLRRWSDIQ